MLKVDGDGQALRLATLTQPLQEHTLQSKNQEQQQPPVVPRRTEWDSAALLRAYKAGPAGEAS